MYATKTPSLRINQADLKCKNGCGFYGTPEWGGKILSHFKYKPSQNWVLGYCSICHRVQNEQQRKTSNHSEHSKSAVPGFSKFEEKKRQQSDKTKKYLKPLNFIRKTSSAKGTVSFSFFNVFLSNQVAGDI